MKLFGTQLVKAMPYFFILGKNPTLSVAEILSVVKDAKIIEATQEFLILEMLPRHSMPGTQASSAWEELQHQLGGTIKVGEIVNWDIKNLESHIIEQAQEGQKFNFGFSFYGNFSASEIKNWQRQAFSIKKELRAKKISSRFVVSKEKNLSSVIVEKEKLLKQGVELCFLKTKNRILIGQTHVVQEFEEYSARDYGRPGRDTLSGMLPPKAAKIMINLSEAKSDDLILDPFCGSGTILQELLLLGYKNIIGSDISQKAINDTKANIKWLISNYGLRTKDYRLINTDVKTLSKVITANSIDAIITEPFLGPPLRGNESKEQLQKIINELSELYLSAFAEFKKILKSNAKIVIIFPAFKTNKEILYLPIVEKVEKLGFKKMEKIGNSLINDLKKINLSFSRRDSLIYSRPDQKVIREIFIFKN